IRAFGRAEYRYFAELNFLENKDAVTAVNGARDADDLFARLSLLFTETLVPGQTLIFLDEIQESIDVITMIKFLVERHEYDFVLSGSLLGVELKNVRSVPVGYLDVVEMYPLDFEEFCWSQLTGMDVLAPVREAFETRAPLDDFVHKQFLSLFRRYLVLGGMAEAVATFNDTHDLAQVRRILDYITVLYREDISKYNPARALTIKEVYDLLPSELNQQNKRFILKNLNEGPAFRRYENDFVWLAEAGVALPTYKVREPKRPLLLSKLRNLFKLFMSDVGLLTSRFLRDSSLAVLDSGLDLNCGAIYENAVAQELLAHGHDLYYYHSKKFGELDFVLENAAGDITAIEVKSGKDYKRHRALSNLLDVQDYTFADAIVLCNGNVEREGRISYLPIYMASML
ncbi:MAG: DUF4143 domain-containing protein, partial [Actinomycetes bacterium]|nr:DUF4143 domain-containing protein [Actinomycetes bacterium]